MGFAPLKPVHLCGIYTLKTGQTTWDWTAKQNYGVLRTSDTKIIERLNKKIRNVDLTYLLIHNMLLIPLILIIQTDRLKILSNIKIANSTESINNFILAVLFTSFILCISVLVFNLYKKTLSTQRFLFFCSIFVQVACMALLNPLVGLIPYTISHWVVEILTSSKAISINTKKFFNFKKYLFSIFLISLVGSIYFKIDYRRNIVKFFLADIQRISFDGAGIITYLQVIVLSFGFFLTVSHFYLTSYIYSNKKIREELFNQ